MNTGYLVFLNLYLGCLIVRICYQLLKKKREGESKKHDCLCGDICCDVLDVDKLVQHGLVGFMVSCPP